MAKQQLTILEYHPTVFMAVKLTLSIGLLFKLQVDHHTSESIGSKQTADDLFPSPKTLGFEDRGRWQIDTLVCICNPAGHPRKFLSCKEGVPISNEESSCKEVLDERNNRFAILRSHDVLCNTHKVEGLASSLESLRKMDVHFVSVKVSIKWRTNTLIKPEGVPG